MNLKHNQDGVDYSIGFYSDCCGEHSNSIFLRSSIRSKEYLFLGDVRVIGGVLFYVNAKILGEIIWNMVDPSTTESACMSLGIKFPCD